MTIASIIESSTVEIPLVEIFRYLDNALTPPTTDNHKLINAELDQLDLTKLNPIVVVGILRFLSTGRDEFESWPTWIETAKVIVQSIGGNPERILRGLL